MSNIKTAIEDKNYLISKLENQIKRLEVKKTRRIDKIERINEALADKKSAITDSEDATVVISKKFHERNKRDTESLEKGIEKRNARLNRFEKRLESLTERVEKYRSAVQDWTNKKIETNRIRAEKRAKAVTAVSIDGIKDYIDKKELYVSILEKRNEQADQLIEEKTKFIEKVKTEIENQKNKPKTKIKLVKQEAEQTEQIVDSVIETNEIEPEAEVTSEVNINTDIEESKENEEEKEFVEIDKIENTDPEVNKVDTKDKSKKQFFKPIQNLRNKQNKK